MSLPQTPDIKDVHYPTLDEKPYASEQVSDPDYTPSSTEQLKDYDIPADEEAKLRRKLDWRIAPVAMMLYLIAFLDRSNIGNAAVGGMTTDLNFPSNGLSVATSVFYATYVAFETPATVLLRSLRPSLFIPGIVIIWGGVVIGNGFANSYEVVIACRLLLGLCEAALSPCLVLYMTTFYKREELALRLCYLYMSSALSGVIGGLVAAGLIKMDGIQGLRGWQWLYIIEGALTVAWGVACFYLIADKYQNARYLNEREKFIMSVRHAQEAAYSHDSGFSWKEIKKALLDPVIWLSGLVQLGLDICLYGYSTFLVVIVNQFGFDRIASQGITAPVYFLQNLSPTPLTPVCAAVYLVAALISMRYQVRYKVLITLAVPTAIGYIILIADPNNIGAKLFACFMAGSAIYVNVGLHVTWLGQNMAGFRKRSTGIGMQQTIGNIGGVIAGQIYRTQDKPGYRLGHAVCLAAWAVFAMGATAEYFIWRSRNAHRERMSVEEKEAIDAKEITGDHHYDFRYAL